MDRNHDTRRNSLDYIQELNRRLGDDVFRTHSIEWLVGTMRAEICVLVLLLLAGCAPYPLGLTKAEWRALSPTQREAYRIQHQAAGEQLQQEIEARQKAFEAGPIMKGAKPP